MESKAPQQRHGSATPRHKAPQQRRGSATPRHKAPQQRRGSATPRHKAPQQRRGSATPRRDGILGFDTSTAATAVAVTVAGELVSERRAEPDPGGHPRHAARLLAEIDAAVAGAGGWERVGVIAVGIGPGTFTGLRVGISTARALGQGRGLGLVPVGSLAALARGIGERAPERLRLAMIDARRGESFAALFDGSGGELWEPTVTGAEALLERIAGLPQSPLAAGDGSLRFRQQLESAGVEVLPEADEAHRMAARQVCALAAGKRPVLAESVRPAYLRRPDAEVWREQRDRNRRPD